MVIQQELAGNKLQPLLPALKSRALQLGAYYQKLDCGPLAQEIFWPSKRGF